VTALRFLASFAGTLHENGLSPETGHFETTLLIALSHNELSWQRN